VPGLGTLTYTDPNPPAPDNPVAPAARSPAARAKASRRRDDHCDTPHSYQGLLSHLATLTRNDVRYAGATATIPTPAEPTPAQRQAFELIGAPVPLTLK